MLTLYFFSLIIPITSTVIHFFVQSIFGFSLSEHSLFIVVYALLAGVALLLYGHEFIASFSYFKEKTGKKILGIFALYLLCQIFLVVLLKLLNMEPQQTENNQAVIDMVSSTPFFISVLIISILGPMVEEIIFRHILIGELSKKVPLVFSSLLSMVLFVLLHSHKYPELIYYIPLTVVITSTYLISKKKVSYSYLFHLVNNLITISVISSGLLTP